MKKYFIVMVICCAIAGCKSPQKMTLLKNVVVLNGSWKLIYILNNEHLDSLYHDRWPEINLNTALQQVSGNTGCNNFNGTVNIKGMRMHFPNSLALTKMMCLDGNGEDIFLTAIIKTASWSVTGKDTLNLISDNVVVMEFVRKINIQ